VVAVAAVTLVGTTVVLQETIRPVCVESFDRRFPMQLGVQPCLLDRLGPRSLRGSSGNSGNINKQKDKHKCKNKNNQERYININY